MHLLNHPGARFQRIQDNHYALEPVEIIQIDQFKGNLANPMLLFTYKLLPTASVFYDLLHATPPMALPGAFPCLKLLSNTEFCLPCIPVSLCCIPQSKESLTLKKTGPELWNF